MDLVRRNIHMDRIKCRAGTQVTLENDLNIPDTKPDAASVVLNKGSVVIEDTASSDNHVRVKGRMQYDVLVQSVEGGLYKATGSIPFDEQVYAEGVTPGDSADVSWGLEDITIDLINSRKLSVHAVMGLQITVDCLWDEEMVTGISAGENGEEEFECNRKKKEVAEIAIRKKDIFRMKEEVELPQNYPNIMEIVWDQVELANVEFKLVEEKITVQGSVQIFVLYESEGEEGKIRTYETAIPFGGTVDCSGAKEKMLADIQYDIGHKEVEVRTDFDGEERVLGLELVLNLDMRMYEEETVEYVADAYGINKEVEIERSDSYYKKILLNQNIKNKVTGQLEAPKISDGILQILHNSGKVQIDEQRMDEKGITVEGAVQIQILFSTGEAAKPYERASGFLPFSYVIELPEHSGQCSYDLRANLSNLMATVSGNGTIEAKAIVGFDIMVFETIQEPKITDIKTWEPDQEKRSRLPGIIGYMVQEGDDLWDIGKRYYVPVSQILEFNNISGSNVRAGDKLLIVKGGNQTT